MDKQLKVQNATISGYFYLSLLLVVYVVWRSISISFTHDECLSYNIITGRDGQIFTANNHWLNTIFMFISSKIFGNSEFALRLPNVIAFVIYLFFIYRIFLEFCNHAISLIIAAPLLLLNPFMLDFFGLARGYGLGMMFFTASIYYFLLYFQRQQRSKYLFLLVASSICCIYSNYAFLMAILAIHGTALLFHFRIHRQKALQLTIFYVAEAILLVPAILNILYLSERNELYAGGENNVFRDTLQSVASFSFSYGDDVYHAKLIAMVLFAISFVLGLFFFKNRSLNFMKVFVLLLLVIPTVLHHAIGMNYPKDRAAIYWAIVAGIFILLAAEAMLENKSRIVRTSAIMLFSAISLLQIINLVPNTNLTHTIIWKYDSDVEDAMQLLEKHVDKSKSYKLGANWFFEPAINYYRETRELKWLQPVNKDEGFLGECHFYMVFKDDLSSLKDRKLVMVKYFRRSGMCLMKRD